MSTYRERVEALEATGYPDGGVRGVYLRGWLSAIDGAAEIAAEADARVAELEAALGAMRGAMPDPRMLDLAADGLRGAGIAYSDELNEAADDIRAALATTDAGAGTGT